MPRALGAQIVAPETAAGAKTSMGADGVNGARSEPRVSGGLVLALCDALEILDGGVDFERRRQMLCTL